MASKGMNKFLQLIGFGDDEPEEESRSAYTPPSRSNASGSVNPYRTGSGAPRGGSSSSNVRSEYRPEPRSSESRYGNSVSSTEGVRMVVLQPQSMEDTQVVIDNLCQGKSIIVNLENLSPEVAQRLLDFISGAIYALRGSIRKVSRGIFLLAPNGVDISGNIASSFAGSIRQAR